MSFVLTLIAEPDTLPAMLPERMRVAFRAVQADILSRGEAVALHCPAAPDPATIRDLIDGAPVDAVVTPAANRRKRLLIADMDSTIVTSETLDTLASFAGIGDTVAAITRRAMAGEIDFKAALRERVALLRGLKLDALEQTWAATSFTPGARALVATMRAHGAVTALVSGGFTFFTSRVAEALGFEMQRANLLLDDGDALLGEVQEPILDRDAKLATLQQLTASRGLGPEDSLAVGDGANDLDMIRAAGLGVAFHAQKIVAEAAQARIDHCGLRALLFIQGYRIREIRE